VARRSVFFFYNASKNIIHDNIFDGCSIGIHYTAGSERNLLYRNTFLGNRTQVQYVGTSQLEWSHEGVGNYWSDHDAVDLNGDGIADTAYHPNDLVDQVMWKYPLARLLLTSLAVRTLREAQRHFPALLPGGVVDSFPLTVPPAK
jgi:nitrous oxidase accessory protein